MKVLVISGFLGAGKTTFIKEIAKRTGREIAIFENEYAASGQDGATLKNEITNGDVTIRELSEDCICCSATGEFEFSVLTIANSTDPEILIIEPTGVGKLSNVMDKLIKIAYERIEILQPLSIIDINSIDRYLATYDDIYKDQIKNAPLIILSKTESSEAALVSDACRQLREINPSAEIISNHYTTKSDGWFDDLFSPARVISAGANSDRKKEPASGEVINFSLPEKMSEQPESFTLKGIEIEALPKLVLLLEDIIRGEFGEIIRVKGSLRISSDASLYFEVSDRRYSISGIESSSESEAVFIGRSIQRQRLRRRLFKSGSHKAYEPGRLLAR